MTDKIRELWDKGYASGSIAIMVGMREREVQKYLRSHDLRRSPSEAREIRKRNGIPFYIHDGAQEAKPKKPRKIFIQGSIYENIETGGGLSPEDLERALKI